MAGLQRLNLGNICPETEQQKFPTARPEITIVSPTKSAPMWYSYIANNFDIRVSDKDGIITMRSYNNMAD